MYNLWNDLQFSVYKVNYRGAAAPKKRSQTSFLKECRLFMDKNKAWSSLACIYR